MISAVPESHLSNVNLRAPFPWSNYWEQIGCRLDSSVILYASSEAYLTNLTYYGYETSILCQYKSSYFRVKHKRIKFEL